MKRKRIPATIIALPLLAASAGAALAQSTDAEIATLRDRVEQLEAQNARTTPRLSFGIGENTELTIYGYVKLDAFYDFDFEQGDFSRPSNIGEPGNATNGTFGTTVRQTRLGFRTNTATSIGNVGTQLELDLFGSGGSAELRLRHANITVGDHWLFGQFWTNFMPIGQYPRTVDFNGPVGITFARVPQVRYSNSINDQLSYSISLEESNGTSNDPLLTAAALYETDRFSGRIAGLYGTATDGTAEVDSTAISLAGSIETWNGGTLTATYVAGQAIDGLLIGGGDAVVGGQANDAEGFTLQFLQDVNDKLTLGVAYGREDYDLPTQTATLDFTELQTVHVNAFYSPTDNLTYSAEYIFGERTTSGGTAFEGNRVQLAVQFSF